MAEKFEKLAQPLREAQKGATTPTKPAATVKPAEPEKKPAVQAEKTAAPVAAEKTPAAEGGESEDVLPRVAAAKKPEAKAEVKPEEAASTQPEIKLPDTASPKAREAWDALKKAHSSREEALRKEIETLKKTAAAPASNDQYEALKKEHEAVLQELAKVNVQSHPKFKQYFDGNMQRAIAIAKGVAGKENEERVQKILLMEDPIEQESAMDDLMLELSPTKQAQMGAIVLGVRSLQAERAAELAKANEHVGRLREEQQAEAQKRIESAKQAMESEISSFQGDDGLPVFQKRTGDTAEDKEWNAAVDKTIERARKIFMGDKVPAQQLARASLYAAAFPTLVKQMHSQAERIAQLEGELQKMTAAEPGGGTSSAGFGDAGGEKAPKSFTERVLSGLGNLQRQP
jgi:hypothetical protein